MPPGTPFENPAYTLAAREESMRLFEAGDGATHAARQANQTSDNFVFGVVLYAIVLSIGGVAPKLVWMRMRQVVLLISVLVLIGATVLTLRLPHDIGFGSRDGGDV